METSTAQTQGVGTGAGRALPARGRGSRLAARSFAVLGALLLACLLAELGLRALVEPPEWVAITPGPTLAPEQAAPGAPPLHLESEARGALELHLRSASGVRLRPNTIALTRNNRLSGLDVEIRVSSLGLRNPELGPKAPARPRVLFLGDSITYADYLPEERTWVRRVEALSSDAPLPLETVNAGIGAIGLEAELALLTEIGDAVQPDLVVLGFYLNDVQDSPGVTILRPPRMLEWSWLVRYTCLAFPSLALHEGSGIPHGTRASWMAAVARTHPPGPGDPLRDRAAFNREIQRAGRDWGSAWSEQAWQRMELLMAEVKRASTRLGARLAILCFPVRLQVESEVADDFPQRRLAEVARRLDVPYLDLLPVLRAAHEASLEPLFFDHCHHTDFGNELVAREVLTFVQDAGR